MRWSRRSRRSAWSSTSPAHAEVVEQRLGGAITDAQVDVDGGQGEHGGLLVTVDRDRSVRRDHPQPTAVAEELEFPTDRGRVEAGHRGDDAVVDAREAVARGHPDVAVPDRQRPHRRSEVDVGRRPVVDESDLGAPSHRPGAVRGDADRGHHTAVAGALERRRAVDGARRRSGIRRTRRRPPPSARLTSGATPTRLPTRPSRSTRTAVSPSRSTHARPLLSTTGAAPLGTPSVTTISGAPR